MTEEGNSPLPSEEHSTPREEDGTAEVQSDLDWLDEEESKEEDRVAKLEAQVNNLSKGFSKFMSQQGRLRKEAPNEARPPQPARHMANDDVETLFFETRPEAERVKEDLQKVAKAHGVSMLQAWKNEGWLREKAKALADEEARRERDQKKVLAPSGTSVPANDYLSMSDDDAMKLPPEEYEKYQKAKASA